MAFETDPSTVERLVVPHRVGLRHRVPALVVTRGPDLGRIIRARHSLVIGRGDGVDVPILDPKVSRRHAILRQRQRGTWIEDLRSKNGTFVNGASVARRVLEDGDLVRLGPRVELRYALADPAEIAFHEALHGAAAQDDLTGVYNARYFDQRLHSEAAYASRHERPLSLVLLELLDLPELFETHGPLADEAALQHVADILRDGIAPEHTLARYGLARFALICPGLPEPDASTLGQELAAQVRSTPVEVRERRLPVTLVWGMAAEVGGGEDLAENLLAAANRALEGSRTAHMVGTLE